MATLTFTFGLTQCYTLNEARLPLFSCPPKFHIHFYYYRASLNLKAGAISYIYMARLIDLDWLDIDTVMT